MVTVSQKKKHNLWRQNGSSSSNEDRFRRRLVPSLLPRRWPENVGVELFWLEKLRSWIVLIKQTMLHANRLLFVNTCYKLDNSNHHLILKKQRLFNSSSIFSTKMARDSPWILLEERTQNPKKQKIAVLCPRIKLPHSNTVNWTFSIWNYSSEKNHNAQLCSLPPKEFRI